jgi:ABC-type multidrug transport system fused ATPase/permease subunit
MKSETSDGGGKDKDSTSSSPGTPVPESTSSASPVDSGSEDGEHSRSVSENATLHTAEESESTAVGTSRVPSEISSSTGSLKKAKASKPPTTPTTPTTAPAVDEEKKKSDSANLVGRMNNLVTSDLQSIVDARDFGMLIVFTPIQIVLCITFLYVVLGWRWVFLLICNEVYNANDSTFFVLDSSLVGLAAMVIMFPLPGYMAKLVQRAQKAKMKKTDARVQTVTESNSHSLS